MECLSLITCTYIQALLQRPAQEVSQLSSEDLKKQLEQLTDTRLKLCLSKVSVALYPDVGTLTKAVDDGVLGVLK